MGAQFIDDACLDPSFVGNLSLISDVCGTALGKKKVHIAKYPDLTKKKVEIYFFCKTLQLKCTRSD